MLVGKSIFARSVGAGFKPAPTKPSGIEWLGEVSEHWETSRLKAPGETEAVLEAFGDPDCQTLRTNSEYASMIPGGTRIILLLSACVMLSRKS